MNWESRAERDCGPHRRADLGRPGQKMFSTRYDHAAARGNALVSNGATSRLFGIAAGADYWFSAHTLAGFALAGGGTNFSVANGGTGRSDLFQAGAFAHLGATFEREFSNITRSCAGNGVVVRDAW